MEILVDRDGRKAVVMEETRENLLAFTQVSNYAFRLMQAKEFSDEEVPKPTSPPSRVVTLDGDGNIVAGLELDNGDVYLKGRPIGHGGIGAVCSLPWYRRQGNVRLAIEGALRYMKVLGKPVSALYPFSFPFYRQFGWELGQTTVGYKVPISGLAQYAKSPGSIHRVTVGREDNPGGDLSRLQAMYSRWVSDIGTAYVRSTSHWLNRNLADLNGKRFACIWMDEAGVDGGYVIYSLNRDSNVSEFRVHELNYGSRAALDGILGFVYAHDSMVKTFSWNAPKGTDLHAKLADPRVDAAIEMHMMFRVVDALAVLRHLAVDYAGPHFTVAVEDQYAPWNRGIYSVAPEMADKVSEEMGADSIVSADVSLSIQRLSQLCSGYMKLSAMSADGLAEANNDLDLSEVDKLFAPTPTYVPYMNDYF